MKKYDVLMIIEGEIVTTQLLERLFKYSSNKHSVSFRKAHVKNLRIYDLLKKNLPLFVRSADPYNLYFVSWLNSVNKSYVYYLDDNFWAITGDTPLAQYYSHPSIRETLDKIVSGAALVIVNSEILADVIREKNANVVVLNAFFDFSLIESMTPEAHSEIRIGFAGSTTRGGDFGVVVPAIRRILAKYREQVFFEFAGILPEGLQEGDNVRYFPPNPDYSSFVKWQYLRGWDVALAPLAPVESNLSKTNNKYREYGACHIAGIYSNYGPYPASVAHGVSGLLVGWDEDEWYDALVYLIDNEIERKSIGCAAYDDVIDKYSIESVAGSWVSALSMVEQKGVGKFKYYIIHGIAHCKIWTRHQVFFQKFLSIYRTIVYRFRVNAGITYRNIRLRSLVLCKTIAYTSRVVAGKILRKIRLKK